MKYYSEELKKLFDTQDECDKAEQEAIAARKKAEEEKERLVAERKARADEVKAAQEAMNQAQENYQKVLSDFCRDYGTYHYSTSNVDDIPKFFNNWDWFLKF